MLNKGLLLAVDNLLAGVEVGLVGLDRAALGDEHVSEDEHEVERDAEVAGDEGGIVEELGRLDEDGVVLGEGDEAAEEEGDVAAPDAEGSAVGHDVVGNLLDAAGLDEVDVSDEDGDPGQDTEDGGQVDKVLEDLLGVIGDVHEGQAGDGGAENQRGIGNATAVGALEDGRGGAVTGQAVEGSAGNVEIRVGGGEDEEQDAGVDDVGQHLDTGKLGGDDEGTGAGTGLLAVGKGELLGVVGDNHADEEDTEAVEDQDTVEGQLDGLGNAAARVLGLASGDTDQLGTEVGKGGVDHDGPEAEEAARLARDGEVAESHGDGKGTGGVPEAEASRVAVGTAANGDDEREQDDAEDDEYLERRQPKLKLAKELDATKVVDAEDEDEEDGDEDTGVDPVGLNPFLDDEGAGGELVGRYDDVLEPVT